ncbi:hypothetical protein FACS1894160_1840 [Bacteroidia bacterium]|nr:hypothetical protein FACS1894160_1840 [Bacteroidia bacterium]
MSNVFGQENVLYSTIQQAKKSNVAFKDVVAFKEVSAEKRVLEYFENLDEVIFFENILPDGNSDVKTQGINLIIPTKNKNITLELIEVPNDFYDYEVETSNGKKNHANKNIKHYRGVMQGENNSLAAITFYENEVMGLISSNDGNFNIVKDKQSGKHIFYNDKNLKEKPSMKCETIDDNSISYESDVLFQPRNNVLQKITTPQLQTDNDKIVKFYFETEYDIYQTRESTSSVEAFITGLFNQVAVLYQNEDITTNISVLYIWTSNDPYTATNTSSLLSQFQNTRTNFIGDLGMLLTFRNVGGGLAAGFSGLCNSSTSQKLAVSMLYNSYDTVPTYSWSVYVVTHEFGHLFGSRHTHACVWNGNNTAIDGCADYVEGSCSLPGYPVDGGTIMSYCHLQSVGINFNFGFGSQPGNVIRNNTNNASCLQACDIPVNFTNQTVSSNDVIVYSCSDINVQNVTVTNNAKLKFDAPGEVIINGPFEVALGSELEVK